MYSLCELFKVTGGFRHVAKRKRREGGRKGGREGERKEGRKREGLGCEVNGE